MFSKSVTVRVTSMISEHEIAITSATSGQQLFDQIMQIYGLHEVCFFGLQYTNYKGDFAWLNLNKKVKNQDIKKEHPLQFQLRVKFFPENVVEELFLFDTKHLFYLQVKKAILSSEIFCTPHILVLLASLEAQALHGDHKKLTETANSLPAGSLLPEHLIKQYALSQEEWNRLIFQFRQQYSGMNREDAMMEYLIIAQDLHMYGINYFKIHNKKGTDLLLGVHAIGFNIYERNDKLRPKIGFLWSEIQRISIAKKKLIMKFFEKKSPDFLCYTPHVTINKRIYDICKGYQDLFMRRNKSKTTVVREIKEDTHQQEREHLQLALAKSEQQQEDVNPLKEGDKVIQRYQCSVNKFENLIMRLREPFKQFKTMRNRYKEGNLEAAEKTKLKEEIMAKIAELKEILKDEEEDDTRSLDEEAEQHLAIDDGYDDDYDDDEDDDKDDDDDEDTGEDRNTED